MTVDAEAEIGIKRKISLRQNPSKYFRNVSYDAEINMDWTREQPWGFRENRNKRETYT